RGPQGPEGPEGPQGPKGQDGTVAFEELTPEQVENLRGEQGPEGPQGPQGPEGPQGEKGQDGTVAFEELTPEQIESLRGEQGPEGPEGPQGPQGPEGSQGPQGLQGEKGDKGETFEEENNILNYSEHVQNSWSDAILEAFKNVDRVYFPEGEYNIEPITLPSGVSIIGSGSSTVFVTDSGLDSFSANGSYDEPKNIVVDVPSFTNKIELEDVSGLSVGDDILVQSCLDSFDDQYGEEWLLGDSSLKVPFGEYKVIKDIEGNVITLDSDLLFPKYPSTNAGLNNPVGNNSTVRKVNFAKDIKIMDLTVKRSKNGAVARFDIAKDCVVDNVTHINDGYVSGYTHLAVLSRCLNVEVRNSLYKLKHREDIISVLDHRNVFKIISSVSSGFKNCVSYNGTQSGDIAVLGGYIPSQQCYF